MSSAAVLRRQFRADLTRFWRNPQSRTFTVLLPLVFLVIFEAIFKGTTIVEGREIEITTFYVPGIMTLGIISASYVNLTQAVVAQRESGELKRLRGTPLPAGFVICSRAAVGVVVAIVMSALLLVVGRVVYGVSFPQAELGWMILAVVLGAASFACVAFAVSTRVRSTESAAPATNLTVLPLYFISGVFVPETQIPKLMHDIAVVFPVYHLAHVMRWTFVAPSGSSVPAGDLVVLAAWGIGALLVAARAFRWSPRSEG